MHAAPRFPCWLQDGGGGWQGEAARQKKLHPSLAWRQVIKESEKQFCKARDAKGREEVPEPQICRHSVWEVLREEGFRASLVNRNGDGCQVGSITPLAPTPRRPRRGIPSPARSPQRHQPRLPMPTEEPPGAAPCLGARQHSSCPVPCARLTPRKHPAAGRAERTLQRDRGWDTDTFQTDPLRELTPPFPLPRPFPTTLLFYPMPIQKG